MLLLTSAHCWFQTSRNYWMPLPWNIIYTHILHVALLSIIVDLQPCGSRYATWRQGCPRCLAVSYPPQRNAQVCVACLFIFTIRMWFITNPTERAISKRYFNTCDWFSIVRRTTMKSSTISCVVRSLSEWMSMWLQCLDSQRNRWRDKVHIVIL